MCYVPVSRNLAQGRMGVGFVHPLLLIPLSSYPPKNGCEAADLLFNCIGEQRGGKSPPLIACTDRPIMKYNCTGFAWQSFGSKVGGAVCRQLLPGERDSC